MRPRSWSPSARRMVGMLFGIFAWGVLAPAPARASCGDYVTMRSQHTSTQANPSSAATTVPGKPTAAPRPWRLPAPCSNPDCSVPQDPGPVTVPASVRALEDWAVASADYQIIRSFLVGPLPMTGSAPSGRRPDTVYRPPRTAWRLLAAWHRQAASGWVCRFRTDNFTCIRIIPWIPRFRPHPVPAYPLRRASGRTVKADPTSRPSDRVFA